MDDPEILSSAPPEVQAERGRILSLRRIRQNIPANSRTTRVAPNQIDLTSVGSGRLAGGSEARSEISARIAGLNTTAPTASTLLNLLHQTKVTREARQENNESQNRVGKRERILERYKKTGISLLASSSSLATENWMQMSRPRFNVDTTIGESMLPGSPLKRRRYCLS